MRSLRVLGVLVLAAGPLLLQGRLPATAGATAAPAALAAPATGDGVVTDTVLEGAGGRLHELQVDSPALGRTVGVRVLLPAGFDDPANADRTWPILWLLHGVGDDHTSWTNKTDVEERTAELPLVIAMPEAGKSADAGWYSDWADGPAWETAHLHDVLPAVEAHVRAGGARERRVVVGFSMGGFGALSYAARHPDLWVGAAAFSGVVCTTCFDLVGALMFETLSPYVGTPGDGVWGPYETSAVTWQGHDPTPLASNLRPVPYLAVRTGNGVPCPGDNPATAPLEAGVYPMNVLLHQRLVDLGIAHGWEARLCGTHDWPWRIADLAATLPGLLAVLADPPPPPTTFDHRFVEDHRDVFGWSFAVTGRTEPAFTDLTAISGAGLTAAGTGTLTVTTPPDHPGTWRVSSPTGSEVVAADADGRLRFAVDLGPDPVTVALAPLDPAAAAAAGGVDGDPALRTGPAAPARLPATGGAVPLALAAAGLLGALGVHRIAAGAAKRPARHDHRAR